MIHHHSPEQSSVYERIGRMEEKLDTLVGMMKNNDIALKEIKHDVCTLYNYLNMLKGASTLLRRAGALLWRAGALVTALFAILYFLVTKFPHWFAP